MIDVAWWNFAALEGLRADARVRVLSRAAFSLLMRLVLEARGDGAVPFINHHDGPASVAAYDLRECDTQDGGRAARAAVQELVDVGLVALDTAARVIRLDLHEGLLSREEHRPAEPAAGVAPSGGPRRSPPSASPERARTRKLRFQFAHRSGPFRRLAIPEGMTWESWSATPEGVAMLAGNDPGTRAERPSERGGNEGGTTRNDPGTTPPLTLSPSENKANNRNQTDSERARNEAGTTPGTTPRNEGGTTPERPRLPTEERLGLHPDDLVAALRAHGKASVLVAGAGDSTVATSLLHALTVLAAGPEAVTRADLDTLARWYAAGAQAWRSQPLGLRELAAKPGMLGEHIEAARAWDRAGRPDPRPTPSAPSRTPGAPGSPGSAPARPTRLRPAPPSPASAFLDDNNPLTDPLLGLL
mgnify:CR=1 FL=1